MPDIPVEVRVQVLQLAAELAPKFVRGGNPKDEKEAA